MSQIIISMMVREVKSLSMMQIACFKWLILKMKNQLIGVDVKPVKGYDEINGNFR